MSKKSGSFYREALKLEAELELEIFYYSRKQALCSKQEQLVTKLDLTHAALIQIVKSGFATDWLTTLSENKDYQ